MASNAILVGRWMLDPLSVAINPLESLPLFDLDSAL